MRSLFAEPLANGDVNKPTPVVKQCYWKIYTSYHTTLHYTTHMVGDFQFPPIKPTNKDLVGQRATQGSKLLNQTAIPDPI